MSSPSKWERQNWGNANINSNNPSNNGFNRNRNRNRNYNGFNRNSLSTSNCRVNKGRCCTFFPEKGFGYIRRNNSNTDIWVHKSEIKGQSSLQKGDIVEFEIDHHGPKQKALNVKITKHQSHPTNQDNNNYSNQDTNSSFGNNNVNNDVNDNNGSFRCAPNNNNTQCAFGNNMNSNEGSSSKPIAAGLDAYFDERNTFLGEFELKALAVCLNNIRDYKTDKYLAERAQLSVGKGFNALGHLKKGDIIKFDARVTMCKIDNRPAYKFVYANNFCSLGSEGGA